MPAAPLAAGIGAPDLTTRHLGPRGRPYDLAHTREDCSQRTDTVTGIDKIPPEVTPWPCPECIPTDELPARPPAEPLADALARIGRRPGAHGPEIALEDQPPLERARAVLRALGRA